MMAKRSIAGANALIFGTLIGILILVGIATWNSLASARAARDVSLHTYQVLSAIQNLNVAVRDAETGQRGYLLTGDEIYLSPYQEASQRILTLEGELRSLVTGDRTEEHLLDTVVPVIRSKFAELARTIEARRDNGFDAAVGIVHTGTGRDDMVVMEAILASMTETERALLARHSVELATGNAWVSALLITGMLAAVLTLLGAARVLYTSASTDLLTGLLSRNRMWELFSAWSRDQTPPMAAMLFVDIDRFRSVNQVFGPVLGDAMIEEAGRRLKPIAGKYPVGRLGGDDFAICCIGITPEEAAQLGRAIVAAFAQPFAVGGRSVHLTVSVGVAHSGAAGGIDPRQGADDAMYVAKYQGGNQAVAFAPSMHSTRKEEAELEEELHRALGEEDQLAVMFQPVVRLSDRKLIAVEALARWSHPRLGSIPPDRFIRIAETRGMIVPLGLKLMELAVRQAAIWHARYPGECPVININISPLQLDVGDVVGDLAGLLERHDLPTGGFCIEVTEGAFTDLHAVRALETARRLGFKVTMDDFGIGYSSLSQLPRLPLGAIKLDRSFISFAAESAGDAAILAAIVQLAHALDLTVIAEGVERADQLKLVTECGCDAVQGYFFSRPLAPDALDAWLTKTAPAVQMVPCGGSNGEIGSELPTLLV